MNMVLAFLKRQWTRICLLSTVFVVIFFALENYKRYTTADTQAFERQFIGFAELSPVIEERRDGSYSKVESYAETAVCDPVRTLMYLKTHKTGSTTLQIIIKRYLNRIKSNSRVIRFPDPFVGGYPGPFRKEFCYINSFSRPYRDLQGDDDWKRPDIMIGHMRFQKDEIKPLLNPNAKYITILRNPLQVFESSFYYYYKEMPHRQNLNNEISCRGEPYLQVMKKLGMSYAEYLERVNKSFLDSAAWGFRSRNYQAFDLGLDPFNMSKEYMLQAARDLDQTFDLVLIVDYFLESLVLLKDLFCMEWEDVVPTHHNRGFYEPHVYNEREKFTVNSLLEQDFALYDYFNKSFWLKVDKYGKERMKKDVEILKNYIQEKESRKSHVRSGISSASKKRKRRDTTFERIFGAENPDIKEDLIVDRIYKKKRSKSVQKQHAVELAQYMKKYDGWCPS